MGNEEDENGQGHLDSFDDSEEIDEDDIVTIVDEDGTERNCVVLAVAEVEGRDYALLAPAEQLQNEEGAELELFIFTYDIDDDDETEVFGWVEDEAVYERVREFFSTLIAQEQEDEEEDVEE
jgi:uncharacterized protein YrzB (UPF0473 family)